MSSYTLFWSPNTYDGRYLLPMVPTLAAGLGFFVTSAIQQRGGWPATTAQAGLLITALISLYFAWESSVTNFAPNLGGNTRWNPTEVYTVFGVTADTLQAAFLETFPNIYNLPLMIVLGVVLYGMVIAVVRVIGTQAVSTQTPHEERQQEGARMRRPALPQDHLSWPTRARFLASFVLLSFGIVLIAVAIDPFAASDDPTEGTAPPIATAAPPETVRQVLLEEADRNNARIEDLQKLDEALSLYRKGFSSYPSTKGALQTLCVYFDQDAGCVLGGVLSPIPVDPNGSDFGYWYASDGASFTLFAAWEGDSAAPTEFDCQSVFTQPSVETLICLSSESRLPGD